MRCSTHCPPESGGLLATAAAVLLALVALAVFVVTHLWLVLGCAAVTVAGAYGFQRVLLRHTVMETPRRGAVVSRHALPAPEPARAISAPRHVIQGVVIEEESWQR